MPANAQRSVGPVQATRASTTCQHCGGSGMLRLDDQRYRTCLPCLGQGRLPQLQAATTVADLLQIEGSTLSAVGSSSAAR
jgi:DnaJ-class molecular chaperone